ncbi:protein kinase [bacterium]|nr:protein kinase [candidate division CSSED10-310 bacterium]
MDYQPGTKWDRYEIIEKLGQGGNCEVYKILDASRNQTLALKILLDNQNVLRFKREFRSMSRLEHPNIAKVFDSGEFQNRAYFTMEYIRGGDLKTLMRKSREARILTGCLVPSENQEFREIADLFIRICEPLQYIHSLRIVHRDLKPANIMLTETGDIKLMDFGLIKETDIIQEHLTRSGMFVGTVAYMSPEQGLGRDLDHRSDLYSLGVVLYEMVTSRTPFKGTGVLDIFMKHIKEPPVPPSVYNQYIPRPLEQLTLALLQKEPSRRPGSAGEVMDYLKRFREPSLAGMEVTITAETVSEDLIDTAMAAIPGLLVPDLIGRDSVLAEFNGVFENIHSTANTIFLIQGEAGIGKTRLMKEAGANARIKGFSVLRGSCLEVERFPYGGFLQPLEILADRLRVESKDEAELILANRGKILSRICPRFEEIEWVAKQAPPVALDPMQDKLRTFDAIKSLLVNAANHRKILLVLEDIHWADELSIEFLHYIARSLSAGETTRRIPIAILATFRSEDIKTDQALHQIINKIKELNIIKSIDLDPLNREQTEQLIRLLLGTEEPDPELLERVYSGSGGNPFFIEEILKGLLEEKILVREGDAWIFEAVETGEYVSVSGSMSLTSTGIPIPDRIRELISRRLDRLNEETRNILIRASVLGMRFEFSVLMRVVEMHEDILLDRMDEAMREDLIEEIPGSGGEVLRFKHNMVRSVLFNGISGRRRVRIHSQAARAILAVHGSGKSEYWELTAFHFDRGRQAQSAVEYYSKSADRALSQYIHESARNYSRRILELLPETGLSGEQLTGWYRDAYRILGLSFEATGNLDQALKEYRKLIQAGADGKDPSVQGIGWYYIGGIQKDRGEFDSAVASFRKCLELLPDTKDNGYRRALTMGNIGGVFINLGNYRKALDVYLTVRKYMLKNDLQPGVAMCDMNIGMIYYYYGRYEESFKWLNSSIDLYKKLDDPFRVAKGLVNLGGIYHARGEKRKAMACNSEALEISRRIGDIYLIATIQGNLGLYHYAGGDYEKSIQSYRESLRISRELGDRLGVAINLINIANLMTDLGADEPAFRSYQEAVGIAEETGERWLKVSADHQFGEFFLVKGQLREARIKFHECYNEADQVGLKSLQIHCRANLAWIDALTGDMETALAEGRKAMQEAECLGDMDAILRSRLRYASICLISKSYSEARKEAVGGLKLSRQRGEVNYEWRFCVIIGRALIHENRPGHARRSLRKAIAVILSINKKVEPSHRKVFFSQEEVRAGIQYLVDLDDRMGLKKEASAYRRFLNIKPAD